MIRISVDRRRPSRRCVVIVDDVPAVTTSWDVLRLIGYSADAAGEWQDREALCEAVAEAEPSAARERSYRLLGYRERSTSELRGRLHEDGYCAAVIDATIERLVELQLVDDERFATAYVRTKVAAGWGSARVTSGLRAHHIEPEVMARVLDEQMTDESQLQRARTLISRLRIVDSRDRQRALARLIRRGFPTNIARQAVASAADVGPATTTTSDDADEPR